MSQLIYLTSRFIDWWDHPENIMFSYDNNKISIFQDYRYIGFITFQPDPIIHLKETDKASLIRSHILRVTACSLRPVTVQCRTLGSEH